SSRPRTRSASSSLAVTTMIGTLPPRWRSALVTSNPSIPGSIRSSRTIRGRSASTAASPEGPSVRHTTRKPSRSRYSRTRSAMDASSSTSSTVPLEGCSGVNQSPFGVGPTLASPGQVRGAPAPGSRAVKILVSRLPTAARPGRRRAGDGRAGGGRRRRGGGGRGRGGGGAEGGAGAGPAPPPRERLGAGAGQQQPAGRDQERAG